MGTMSVLFGFGFTPGPMELLIIGVIILLLFGSRLPSTMRNLGKGMREFKEGLKETEGEINQSSESKSDSQA